MYKVIIEELTQIKIKQFILYYKNSFLSTYTDTGIFYEDIIKQNYINNASKFQNEIFDLLEKTIREEIIIGYKPLDNNKYETTNIVGNFRLFIKYFESKEEKARIIKDIKICKK